METHEKFLEEDEFSLASFKETRYYDFVVYHGERIYNAIVFVDKEEKIEHWAIENEIGQKLKENDELGLKIIRYIDSRWENITKKHKNIYKKEDLEQN